MKVSVKDTGPCRKMMHVAADADEVRADYETVMGQFSEVARVPGFRPGKAPAKLVERQYAKRINEEVKDRLVPRLYHAALAQEGITPVSIVGVSEVEFSRNEGITFDVTLDVAPDIKLPKYKKIALESKPVEVTEEDVSKSIEQLRERFSRFEDAPEGQVAADGDALQLDYHAEFEGRPLAELTASCAGLAEAKDQWVVLGDPEFLPGIREGLIGAGRNEHRDLTVRFPPDYHVAEVAGKETVFHVEVKGIRQRITPPLDEAFFQRLGVADEAQLRERIRTDMREARERAERDRLRDEAAAFLLSKTTCDLPESIVTQETNLMIRSVVRRSVMQGVTSEQIEEQREDILHAAQASSLERVKLSYILTRIAEEEKIEVSQEEIEERIKTTAGSYQMTPEKFRAELEKNNRLEALASDVRADKAMDFVLEHAKIK